MSTTSTTPDCVQCFLIFCQGCECVSVVDHPLSPTPCLHPLASVVSECCLLARRVTIDVQVSVSVDQEFASMCLRRHKKRKLAEIVLWESPPGADVLLTARDHPWQRLLASVGVSMKLGDVPAGMGSSYAGLCRRRDPEDSDVAPTVRRALQAQILAPIELFLGTADSTTNPWLKKLVDVSSWGGEREPVHTMAGYFLYFCPRIFSYGVACVSAHVVSCENPTWRV